MMFDITFTGQEEFLNFGRGKDKAKRKSRVSVAAGAGLGTVAGGPVGTIAGGLIAKGINKEKDRYEKQGPRSHLGKIGHDAKLGAKSVGIGSAITAGLAGAALGSKLPTVKKKGFLGLGRDKKAESRQKLKNVLMGAGLGVLGGGVSGAVSGAGNGALVGATRGFVQENKTKKKKGKFSSSTKLAEFALTLPSSKQKKNKVGLKTGATVGFLRGGPIGAVGLGLAGSAVDRQIDKEQQRFKKSGPKSRIGKIKNDAKIGAKTIGTLGAIGGGLTGASMQGTAKQKLAMAAGGATARGITGAIKGAIGGSAVGAVRGFKQPNKKKSLLERLKK